MLKFGLLLLSLLVLSGCTSSSPGFASRSRPVVNADAVQVYFRPPTGRYDNVGIVTGRPITGTSGRDDLDLAIIDLKRQAGDLGANAVIVLSIRRPNQNSFGMGSDIAPVVGFSGLVVTGRAIFLLGEGS